MNKSIIASLLLAISLCATGCVAIPAAPGDTKTNEPATQNPELTQTSTSNIPLSPETTTAPKTLKKNEAMLGAAYAIGNWSVTINSATYAPKLSDNDYYGYVADEGSQYLIVNLTVTNNGKTADAFVKTYSFGSDFVHAKVLYKSEYEYTSAKMLSYSPDLHDKSVQPLASTTGEIIFSLPDTVVNGDNEAELILYDQNAQISLVIGENIAKSAPETTQVPETIAAAEPSSWNNCPLEITGYIGGSSYNQYFKLTFKNASSKDIDSAKVVFSFDSYESEYNYTTGLMTTTPKPFTADVSLESIWSGGEFAQSYSLKNRNIRTANIYVACVYFKDGTKWGDSSATIDTLKQYVTPKQISVPSENVVYYNDVSKP